MQVLIFLVFVVAIIAASANSVDTGNSETGNEGGPGISMDILVEMGLVEKGCYEDCFKVECQSL